MAGFSTFEDALIIAEKIIERQIGSNFKLSCIYYHFRFNKNLNNVFILKDLNNFLKLLIHL